jgi:polyphosphate glucokinase
MKKPTTLLGIDVGASGIKGAIVDTITGKLMGERFRVDMPQPSTPEAAAKALNEIVKNFNYQGKIGIGFPSVIKNGVATTAANLDKSWVNCNAEEIFKKETGCDVIMINDADAAGIAEMRFGVGKGVMGTVVLITIGTGLGSAVFTDGHLLRNTEFGHVFLKNGKIAEHHASNSAQKRDGLTLKEWAKRFNDYLKLIELYLQPALIILGGGTSKYFEEFKKKIKIETPVVPAQKLNNAGIVGAAIFAAEKD